MCELSFSSSKQLTSSFKIGDSYPQTVVLYFVPENRFSSGSNFTSERRFIFLHLSHRMGVHFLERKSYYIYRSLCNWVHIDNHEIILVQCYKQEQHQNVTGNRLDH